MINEDVFDYVMDCTDYNNINDIMEESFIDINDDYFEEKVDKQKLKANTKKAGKIALTIGAITVLIGALFKLKSYLKLKKSEKDVAKLDKLRSEEAIKSLDNDIGWLKTQISIYTDFKNDQKNEKSFEDQYNSKDKSKMSKREKQGWALDIACEKKGYDKIIDEYKAISKSITDYLAKKDFSDVYNFANSITKQINAVLPSVPKTESVDINIYNLPQSLFIYSEGANNTKQLKENIEYDYVFSNITESEYNSLLFDLDNYIAESLEEEFSIGNMLPQCGSTEGIGDPYSILNDITDSKLDGIDLPDDIEIDESVLEYINIPEYEYNVYVEGAIKDFANKIANKVKISFKTRKALTERAVIKAKIKVAKMKKTNFGLINDLKRDLISKEKEIRGLKKGLDPELIQAVNKLGKEIEEKVVSKEVKKAEKSLVKESVDDYYEEKVDKEKLKKNAALVAKYTLLAAKIGVGIAIVVKIIKFLKRNIKPSKEEIKRDEERKKVNEDNQKQREKISPYKKYIDELNNYKQDLGDIRMRITYIKSKDKTKISDDDCDKMYDKAQSIFNKIGNVLLDISNEEFDEKEMGVISGLIKDFHNQYDKYTESTDSYIDLLSDRKEDLSVKLESAYKNDDLDKITVYQNKIKYIDLQIKNQNEFNNSFITEAAKIEKGIKPIIKKLNQKGYKTKYSSNGHSKLVKKEDKNKNSVYYNGLYSDARIMFDGDYKFPAAPKYWIWKKVDGVDYLDIVPQRYNEKDGDPTEAFARWKENYMGTLERWVDKLPDKKTEKYKKEKDMSESVIDDIMDDIITEFADDIFEDFGITI